MGTQTLRKKSTTKPVVKSSQPSSPPLPDSRKCLEEPPKSRMALIRLSRGLRQRDIELLTGLTMATVNSAERHGRVSPRTKRLIARVLGVDPAMLFGNGPGDAQ